jgi:hypothetical protein
LRHGLVHGGVGASIHPAYPTLEALTGWSSGMSPFQPSPGFCTQCPAPIGEGATPSKGLFPTSPQGSSGREDLPPPSRILREAAWFGGRYGQLAPRDA